MRGKVIFCYVESSAFFSVFLSREILILSAVHDAAFENPFYTFEADVVALFTFFILNFYSAY